MKDILIAMGCMWGVMSLFACLLTLCILLLALPYAIPLVCVLIIIYGISLFKLWDSRIFQKLD